MFRDTVTIYRRHSNIFFFHSSVAIGTWRISLLFSAVVTAVPAEQSKLYAINVVQNPLFPHTIAGKMTIFHVLPSFNAKNEDSASFTHGMDHQRVW